MFRISSDPIQVKSPEGTSSGGRVTFEGIVRDETSGREVIELQYEAYEELAVKEGERVLAEAVERFGLDRAECVHRVGTLKPGEVAVRIVAESAHRDAAFQGCRYLIDEIKARVPIWKKEIFADGESEWVDPTGATRAAPQR